MQRLTKQTTEILEDILGSVERGVPYHLTFAPTYSLSPEEKEDLESFLKKAFERWARSWIVSRVNKLLGRV